MGKYRTFSNKIAHFDGRLDPRKSVFHGNAQHGRKESPGNLSVRRKFLWAKCKESSFYRQHKGYSHRLLIALIFVSSLFLNTPHCSAAPTAEELKAPIELIVHDSSVTSTGNFSHRVNFTDAFEDSSSWQSSIPRNCTRPSSEEFPADLFTLEQRQNGAIAIHFFALCYMLYALLVVCDAYFVPAIECICQELRISPNVAGATFMAISTSAPELFTNVIGTFVTKGDLGVGTIVGSAVFNVLAVGTCIGIGTNIAVKTMVAGSRNKGKGVPLDWWSLSRDTAYYLMAVAILIGVLFDGRVYWFEAAAMLAVYGLYIAGMCYDNQCKEFTETLLQKLGHIFSCDGNETRGRKLSTVLKQKIMESGEETSPLIGQGCGGTYYGTGCTHQAQYTKQSLRPSLAEVLSVPNESFDSNSLSSQTSSSSEDSNISTMAAFDALKDVISFPIKLVLRYTIPDCRIESMRKWCGLSLMCCVAWIGGLSYVISWMVCIIGATFGIPDSVSGLTFLAAGTSFPEVLSSVIVARQGLGSMGLSNSVGSNTFDILVCLGLPWLIQSVILTSNDNDFIAIHSGGLEYSASLLVASMIILYLIIAFNDYTLDTKVGISCLLMYLVFITVACLLEMNVFFPVNLPPC